MNKPVPSPAVLSDIEKMLQSLAVAHKAEVAVPSAGTPDEKVAEEQGTLANSNVADAKLVASRSGEDNGNELPKLEVGDDPAKAEFGPDVTDTEATGNEEIIDSGDAASVKTSSEPSAADIDIKKVAEAMIAELDLVEKSLLHLAATEVVGDVAEAGAEVEGEDIIAGAIPEIVDTFGVDEDTAAAIAEAIASGDITEEDLSRALEEQSMIEEIKEATGATDEEIAQMAEEVGQQVEASGKTPDEVVADAMGMLQKQAMAELREEYNALNGIQRKARAERDGFTVRLAGAKMAEIENKIKSMFGVQHIAEDADQDGIDDASAADPEASTDAEADTSDTPAEAPEAPAADGDAAIPQEDAAAAMLAGGVAPEQLQIVQDAIQELVDSEQIPLEVVAQVVGEKMAGQTPDLTKVAAAEVLSNPRIRAHVALDMAVRKAYESMKETK